MAQNNLRRRLPITASLGEQRLAEALEEIFHSNGVDMTVIYQYPLALMASEEECEAYQVKGMTVDFYVKELNLAIEYQGGQHYKDNGYYTGQLERDERKRDFLKRRRVNLVEIPHTLGDSFTTQDICERLGLC